MITSFLIRNLAPIQRKQSRYFVKSRTEQYAGNMHNHSACAGRTGAWGQSLPTSFLHNLADLHCLPVQCLCQQRTGTAADHIRTGLRKGSACLNMDISRGLKVAQLLAGFPDGITLYVDRPFIPREYQCFSWLGTAPSVYLCNLRACWLLHQDESVPLNERGMEMTRAHGQEIIKKVKALIIQSEKLKPIPRI